MIITGTHVNYYLVCHRKLWLFANSIQMEHGSDLVYEGKLIQESSYQNRSSRYEEIEVAGIKIDYYDPKEKLIHEIKKSSKIEEAHEWQVKYYIYVLERHGVEGVTGLLEYPKMRKTNEIYLTGKDRKEIEHFLIQIEEIVLSEACPPTINKPVCKNCSYYDFCYSGEV